MDKGRRGVRCVIIGVLLSLAFSVNVQAAELPMASLPDDGGSHEAEIMSEKTMWRYRTYKGVLQKRLWSITYKRWKTKWINC
ncbi:MAG: hypothetical protein HFE75_02030 [Firmicutes bacterium]|nr:hypothetical protein [Bacillota bacterium]